MKLTTSLAVTALALVLAIPGMAGDKHKKKGPQRAMVENMQAVPCGAKEHGITGLGTLWASAGITHVNSDEKLCPQYLLRTDDMEYHVRPMDKKHSALLPVGEESEFKIKKDRLFLRVVDGDHKMRPYQVVSMAPLDNSGTMQSSTYRSPEKPATDYHATRPGDNVASRTPPTQSSPPPR